MTREKHDTQNEKASQATFEATVREQLQQAVRTAIISLLEAEVEAFIGAVRYERSEQRQDYRNGHYSRSLETGMGHIDDLPVPRTRRGYQTHLFERYNQATRRRNCTQLLTNYLPVS
jgi:putative transposase